jgi:hypothetical protein
MSELRYRAPQKRANWYLRAEELRTLAGEAHDPEVAAMMRRIAADYERLAKWAEESEGLGIDLSSAGAGGRYRVANGSARGAKGA